MKKWIYVAAIPSGLVALGLINSVVGVVNSIPLLSDVFTLVGFFYVVRFLLNNVKAENREQTAAAVKEAAVDLLGSEEAAENVINDTMVGIQKMLRFATKFYVQKENSEEVVDGPFETAAEAAAVAGDDEMVVKKKFSKQTPYVPPVQNEIDLGE